MIGSTLKAIDRNLERLLSAAVDTLTSDKSCWHARFAALLYTFASFGIVALVVSAEIQGWAFVVIMALVAADSALMLVVTLRVFEKTKKQSDC